MRYALVQLNPVVGDLEGNAALILDACERAVAYAPDLVVFPEAALTGAPALDLLLRGDFLAAAERTMQELAARLPGNALVGYPFHPSFAGHPRPAAPVDAQERPRNAAALVSGGAVRGEGHQCLIATDTPWDAARYFAPGSRAFAVSLEGGARRQIAGVIPGTAGLVADSPAAACAADGAEVIIVPAAVPFHRRAEAGRGARLGEFARRHGVYLLYCNLAGGQDDLVFAGGSRIVAPDGTTLAQAALCAEDMLVVDVPEGQEPETFAAAAPSANYPVTKATAPVAAAAPAAPLPARAAPAPYDDLAATYAAIVQGTRDYVRKNRFPGVVVGLSGGIDSALVAAVAVDALGKDAVFGVTMPSRFSSAATKDDAQALAENLGIRFETLPVAGPYAAFEEQLRPLYAGAAPERDPEDLTAQNLQARIRAVYLMALANKYGLLMLNTSNKSEGAVGYGTLYGDTAGGYGPIKDVLKTDVWNLARHVNALHGREVIPETTIERVPSAELRENQEDRQSLPDYPVLDPVLELALEHGRGERDIVAAGYPPEVVRRVLRLIAKSEFKRRQGAFGPRLTPKPWADAPRLPVTARYPS